MDRNPFVLGLKLALGDITAWADQLETRSFQVRCGGLYVAPELPADKAEDIAANVVLSIAYIALGRAS